MAFSRQIFKNLPVIRDLEVDDDVYYDVEQRQEFFGEVLAVLQPVDELLFKFTDFFLDLFQDR